MVLTKYVTVLQTKKRFESALLSYNRAVNFVSKLTLSDKIALHAGYTWKHSLNDNAVCSAAVIQ